MPRTKKHCLPNGKQCFTQNEGFSALRTFICRATAAFFAFSAGVSAFATFFALCTRVSAFAVGFTFFAATAFAIFAFLAFGFSRLFFALLALFAVFAFFALFLFVVVAVYVSRNLSRGRCVFCKSRVTYTRKSECKKKGERKH